MEWLTESALNAVRAAEAALNAAENAEEKLVGLLRSSLQAAQGVLEAVQRHAANSSDDPNKVRL